MNGLGALFERLKAQYKPGEFLFSSSLPGSWG
jgi:hypothetical protein